MITARTELSCHGLCLQPPHPDVRRQHQGREPRELYTSARFRTWFKHTLPDIKPTSYQTHESPKIEASVILSRFAAGARLVVEPEEDTPGDIKRLEVRDQGIQVRPYEDCIWELKTGDIRIFGWFHAHDCFVAHSGDDATLTKELNRYQQHIDSALEFLAQTGLAALSGDHHRVLTL